MTDHHRFVAQVGFGRGVSLPRPLRPLRGWLATDGWLNAVALGVNLVVLGLLVAARDVPLVDLPQHAAQLVTWERWDAGDPAILERFELNFRTPYLLAYPVARVLAPLVGAVMALKLVVALAIAANQWTVTHLARKLGHDAWLGLLGAVTAAGLCFYFGFVSFMLAMPLAVLALSLALEHGARPRLASGVALGLVLCALLSAHGVAFAMGFGCAALLLVRGGGSLAARAAPLLGPVALAVVWLAPGPVSQRIGGDSWDLTPRRFIDLPALLVGMGASDHVAFVLGLAVIAVAARLLGGRLTRKPERLLPFVLLFVGYAFFPAMFRGIVLLHTRLPCFLLPLALLAFEAPQSDEGSRIARGATCAVSLVWLAVFATRLAVFQAEAGGFHRLVARLPRELRMRPIIFDRESRVFPGVPAYLHYSAYYYVEKGGTQGYSFAMYPISVVRLRPEVRATMQGGAEWLPELFRKDEVADYDYFLVRSESDRGPELFEGTDVTLDAHEGQWWGYGRRLAEDGRVSQATR